MADVLNVKEISTFQKWKSIFFFAWKRRPSLTVFTISFFLGVVYLVYSGNISIWHTLLEKFVNSPLDIAIKGVFLLAATSIWIYQVAQDWKKELPKFLSVDFVYNEKIRIRCCYAPLLGESDARGMAQSLGQAINKGARLPIAPTLDKIKIVEMKDDSGHINRGEVFLHYSMMVKMTEDVQRLGAKPNKDNQRDEGSSHKSKTDCDGLEGMPDCIPVDKYLCWSWPFEPPTNDDLEPYGGK